MRPRRFVWRRASASGAGVLLLASLMAGGCAPGPALVDAAARHHPGTVFSFATADSLVALTLDDGPHGAITPAVLDLLAEHGARATFFVTGRYVEGQEALLRRIVAEGHELGNHGMSETPSALLSAGRFEAELREAHALLAPFDSVRWFRPATGFYNRRIREAAEAMGYTLALGSVYPNDVHSPLASLSARRVLRHVRPGAVVILHEGRTGRRTVLPILERVLPELRRRGYRVVTLSELADHVGRDSD